MSKYHLDPTDPEQLYQEWTADPDQLLSKLMRLRAPGALACFYILCHEIKRRDENVDIFAAKVNDHAFSLLNRSSWKLLQAKYGSKCYLCEIPVKDGQKILWRRFGGLSKVCHIACFTRQHDYLEDLPDCLADEAVAILKERVHDLKAYVAALKEMLLEKDDD